jgi:hypothetical protein
MHAPFVSDKARIRRYVMFAPAMKSPREYWSDILGAGAWYRSVALGYNIADIQQKEERKRVGASNLIDSLITRKAPHSPSAGCFCRLIPRSPASHLGVRLRQSMATRSFSNQKPLPPWGNSALPRAWKISPTRNLERETLLTGGCRFQKKSVFLLKLPSGYPYTSLGARKAELVKQNSCCLNKFSFHEPAKDWLFLLSLRESLLVISTESHLRARTRLYNIVGLGKTSRHCNTTNVKMAKLGRLACTRDPT